MSVLDVRGLRIAFGAQRVVDGVDLAIEPGECVAIVGESGAGKSLTARAMLGLLPPEAVLSAERLEIDGREMHGRRARDWRRVRGATVALVSQDALAALDPLQTIGSAVAEPLRIQGRAVAGHVQRMLERVSMPEPQRRARQYPHELSGGLRQRALIASALAGEPQLLVADEPTTALDATVQARVLDLVRSIADAGTAVLFISHDFAAVRRVADRILVMREGRVVEQGSSARVLDDPQDAYTQALIAATVHAPRAEPDAAPEPIVEVSRVERSYAGIPAVRDASFVVGRGSTLGIVGESGSGKTTLARMIVGVERPDAGRVLRFGEPRVQLVHQNPLGAFDPRWTIARSLREALQAAGEPRARWRARVDDLLAEVGLSAELGARRPWQLSGGQRQRAAIARALAADPDVLVLDEPVSALDPTVRERILDLLRRLQRDRGLAMLFVSHDLDVVAAVADEVIVMQDGAIVEEGPVSRVFTAPQHPFTQELLDASR